MTVNQRLNEEALEPYKKVAIILLLLTGIFFGTIPIFATIMGDLGFYVIEQVFIRLMISSIIGITLIGFLLLRNRQLSPITLNKQQWQFTFALAIILIFMIHVYLIAVALGIPVGEAALLIQVQVPVTIILSALLFKEKIMRKEVLAITSAISGIIVLTHPWTLDEIGSSLLGDLFAIFNGILYSSYIITSKLEARSSKEKTLEHKTPMQSFFQLMLILSIAGILNSCLTLLIGNAFEDTTIGVLRSSSFESFDFWLYGSLLAVVSTIIPYGIIVWAAQHVSGSQMALLLLMEPISAGIIGWILLNQPITIYYLFGGSLIFLAVWLVSKGDQN
ncbi:MAG: DMT family transporter [Candidatus Kariarchaeaceae archaeon]